MKKLIKIVCMILIIAVISEGMVYQQTDAKYIPFAGQYKMNYSSEEYFVLDMNKYAFPKGKKVGGFTIWYGYKPTGLHPWYEGTLKEIGENKYQYKKGKMKLTFKVHKKKIVLSGNKHCDDSILGTYKPY